MQQRTKRTVLLVGATGYVGGKVAAIAASRGWRIRALVRPSSNAARLVALGAEIAQGDLLDPASLERAMKDCDTVITSAIGYANRKQGDLASPIDSRGNRNLADAALRAGVERVVFCSVLTCDRAREVPHFWDKKLTEDYLEHTGVPFVALRPGAFLDQGPTDFWKAGLEAGRLRFLSSPNVPATFVHTDDVARCLVDAVELRTEHRALRVDLGCDRPVSIVELARIMSAISKRAIRPQVPPWPLVSAGLAVAGMLDPWKRDLRAMMNYFQQGGYVADVTQQRKYFGEPQAIEAAVRRYLIEIGLVAGATNAESRQWCERRTEG